MMLHTKYQVSRPCGFRQVSSRKSHFNLYDLDMEWTETILAIIEAGRIRIFLLSLVKMHPAA